jgi:hypothetical protein
MYKVIAQWSGFPGAPGFSNFYFGSTVSGSGLNAENAMLRVKAFFDGITLCLPVDVHIQVHGNPQIIDPATGDVTGSIATGDEPAETVGAGGEFFSAISGACVIWRTGVALGSTLLKGKTFVVPMSSAAYGTSGGILPTRLAELRTAALTLAQPDEFPPEESLVVWHRPGGEVAGQAINTTGATVSDRAAYLKSRRS